MFMFISFSCFSIELIQVNFGLPCLLLYLSIAYFKDFAAGVLGSNLKTWKTWTIEIKINEKILYSKDNRLLNGEQYTFEE